MENTRESLLGKLEKIRGKITANRHERTNIEQLPPPADVAIVAMTKKVDRQAAMLAHPDSELHRQTAGTLLIVIFGPELKQRLTEHIKSTWPKETASDEDKAVRIAKLDSVLLQLELDEEATAVALERLGVTVDRRGDLNPAVFLEMIAPGEAG